GVQTIGEYAFYECKSLASVTIPASVRRIHTKPFANCPSLREIRFGGTRAQWNAIEGSDGVNAMRTERAAQPRLRASQAGGGNPGIVIRGADGNIGVEFVPSYLRMDDVTVTGYDGTVPADLVIPEGVTAIGEYAFSDCASLASVTISKDVTSIGNDAFRRCTSLVSITIPAGVTSIGDDAFNDCKSLKEIQFKGTMAQWKAIKGSSKIKIPGIGCSDGYIGVKDAPEYLKMDGTKVAGHTGEVPANVVIPHGITAIGEEAFKDCTTLASVTIPDGVTKIGARAFSKCTSLANVVIPDSVTEIGREAFSGCTSLKTVVIAGGITTIGGRNSYDKGVFYGCTSLESVTIPDSVTEIGEYAFYGCASLKEVQFGGTKAQWKALKGSNGIKVSFVRCSDGDMGVEHVPEYLKISRTEDRIALTGHTGTVPADLVIPEGVTEIGYGAFAGCTSLASVIIPDSVTEIYGGSYYENGGAFLGCTSLASVTIPASVAEIGTGAFKNCASLKEIQFGGTMAQWQALKGSGDIQVSFVRCSDGNIGVEEIPEYLKMDGTKVAGYIGKVPADLVIPEGVTGIKSEAFKDCLDIENVTIPGCVTEIEYDAFSECTYLERVTIEEGVKIIGEDAFSGCTSLASVTIPNSVTAISHGAFYGCASLESVIISNNMTAIGNRRDKGPFSNDEIKGAFEGCTSLASVVIPDSVKIIGDKAFKDCTSLASVAIPGSVTHIYDGAFNGCKTLASVVVPKNVTYIGEQAFEGCTSLVSVVIPESVTEIGIEAFKNCTSLADVTIPGSVTEISYGMFYGCKNLKSVIISRGVKTIDESAFFTGSASLASVSIPRSMTKIGSDVFTGGLHLKIQYDGTKAQWKAIIKDYHPYGIRMGSGGNFRYALVQCKDGDITE
ncbi:MAG: leucine-rich repeat domain-containing protein, partial [Treponemataceae bacterium]|nr:leucine-rich repeat domain-containing protein [Treponemataceae bacterium]